MSEFSYDQYQNAVDYIRQQISSTPRIGMILGSGLGPLADSVENATIVPYENIPHFPKGNVHGHKGRLVIGQLEGRDVLVMQGRAHFYEGLSMKSVGFPIRVMQLLGIQTLVVTNAAGGLNQSFNQGDLMIIKDHINFTGLVGNNPLMGANDNRLGPRFPILTAAYAPSLRKLAKDAADAEGIHVQEGVYVSLSGPMFETPAEVNFLRIIGGDAVGMSTAPEVVVANHAGMQVLGVSSITNISIDDPESTQDVSHEEVLEVGQTIVPRLTAILRGVLRRLPNNN